MPRQKKSRKKIKPITGGIELGIFLEQRGVILEEASLGDNLQEEFTKDPEFYEECVQCHILTDIPKNTHVDFRFGYIETVGQLCPKCFSELDE